MVSPAAPPEPLARGPEVLGISNLAQAEKFFGQKFAAFGRRRKVMRIIHKPVALAWRQRARAALRARAAATLPPAFVNNSHDFYPTREAFPKVPTFYRFREIDHADDSEIVPPWVPDGGIGSTRSVGSIALRTSNRKFSSN